MANSDPGYGGGAYGYSSRSYAIPGQSFLSADGTNWYDLYSYLSGSPAKACLKAFAAQ